jgi:hypothetical protein
MSQYTSRGHFDEEAEGRIHRAYDRAQELIGENPGYSALACFGVGLCVGAGLTLLLSTPKKETTWYQGYLPDEGAASDLARHVRDTVARVVPDAVARYLKRR